jgi:hypothetical protein
MDYIIPGSCSIFFVLVSVCPSQAIFLFWLASNMAFLFSW